MGSDFMCATGCAVASKWGNACGGLWQVSFCFVASLLCCVYKSAVLPRLLVSLLQNMYVEMCYMPHSIQSLVLCMPRCAKLHWSNKPPANAAYTETQYRNKALSYKNNATARVTNHPDLHTSQLCPIDWKKGHSEMALHNESKK